MYAGDRDQASTNRNESCVPTRVDQRSTSKVTSLKGKSANSDLCNSAVHCFRLARACQQLWNRFVATKCPKRVQFRKAFI